MKKTLLKGKHVAFLLGSISLFAFMACCSPKKQEPEPIVKPIVDPAFVPGEEETESNIITFVTEKPIGSTLALSFELNEEGKDNPDLYFTRMQGLGDFSEVEKRGRRYWLFTITEPVIKIKGAIERLDLSIPTDVNLEKLEESNRIKSIVVSPTIYLKSLIYNNDDEEPTLGYVNVSKAPNLAYLLVPNGKLNKLDVTQNKKLVSLYCGNNGLTELDLSQNALLKALAVSNNVLKRLDVHHMTALSILECAKCGLTELDLTDNEKLSFIDVRGNALTTLDVRNKPSLAAVEASDNKLKIVYFGKHNFLTNLDVSNNNLSLLDLSGLSALTYLECYRNELSKLNLSHSSKLCYVTCFENKIQGKAMNDMMRSLPTSEQEAKIAVFNPMTKSECNVCLKSDVAEATRRNWTCYQVAKPFEASFFFARHGAVYEGK